MSIYAEIRATGGYIDNHESDLYVEDNAVNREIINRHFGGNTKTVKRFLNQVTGKWCLDVPFCYDPFWDSVAIRAALDSVFSHQKL
jgi:hypothetical protein